jgi:hypothetical protein
LGLQRTALPKHLAAFVRFDTHCVAFFFFRFWHRGRKKKKVFNKCSEEGEISPQTCVYLANWLEFWEEEKEKEESPMK